MEISLTKKIISYLVVHIFQTSWSPWSHVYNLLEMEDSPCLFHTLGTWLTLTPSHCRLKHVFLLEVGLLWPGGWSWYLATCSSPMLLSSHYTVIPCVFYWFIIPLILCTHTHTHNFKLCENINLSSEPSFLTQTCSRSVRGTYWVTNKCTFWINKRHSANKCEEVLQTLYARLNHKISTNPEASHNYWTIKFTDYLPRVP